MINRMYVITLLSVLPFTACGSAQGGEKAEAPEVYFIREITPQNMVRIYEALERPATGKVAVKLSTGEPGGHNYLKPELIKDIVTKVGGTIVECNTAYGGGRARTQDHLKAAADHGFTAIAPVAEHVEIHLHVLPVGCGHICIDKLVCDQRRANFKLISHRQTPLHSPADFLFSS